MTNPFPRVRLGDVCGIIMGQSPKSEYYNSDGEGMPFLQGNRTFGLKYPTFDTYTTFVTKKAEPNDVIMSVRAPVGELNVTPIEMCLGRGVCALRMKNREQEFLYYLMKANVQRLIKLQSGTVFGSVNHDDIAKLEIPLPPLPVQRSIAATLSCLDDKIELNRRVNANLEAQAQALFRDYFSQRHKDTKGWRVGRLGEIADITSGKRPPSRNSEQTDEHPIPIVGASSVMGYTSEVLYNEPVLIIGRVGTHGIVQRFLDSCWPSDNTLIITSTHYEFVYHVLKSIDYKSLNRGTTQPLITQTDIMKVPVILPDDKTLKEFEDCTSALMQYGYHINKQSRALAAVRDTLLPPLMSGEIEVEG